MRLEPDKECLVCDYCGSYYFPEPNADGVRVLQEPSSLACPLCAVPLVHAAISRHRMLYCTHCRGMLVAMDSFVAIVHELRSRHETASDAAVQPDWKEMGRHLRCPQCQKPMDTHPYGGGGNVIVESCEACSLLWLDFTELDRIVRAPDREYLAEAWDTLPASDS